MVNVRRDKSGVILLNSKTDYSKPLYKIYIFYENSTLF